MEARAAAARDAHRLSLGSESQARVHRERRDAYVVRLHDEDGWSYTRIAKAVGCSKELVAKIVQAGLREVRDDQCEACATCAA